MTLATRPFPSAKGCTSPLEAFLQGASHELRCDEDGVAGSVRLDLELPRSDFGPSGQHDMMATPEQVEERFQIVDHLDGAMRHFLRIGQQAIGTEDVVSVFGASLGNAVLEDNAERLVDLELSSFDVVREIRSAGSA